MERLDMETYTTEIRYRNATAEDVMLRLCSAFREEGDVLKENVTLRDLIGIFSYLCQYITNEELSLLVSPVFSDSSSVKLSNMVRDKGLNKWPFAAGTEFNSRCAFSPTASTCESYAPFFYCQTSKPKTKRNRNNGKVPMHDFALGINMLHLLNSPFSFSWSKEETLTGIYKVKAALSIDMLIMLKGAAEPHTNLFIEQDMCTEPISTLLSKIELYDRHDLAAGDFYILLFSIYMGSTGRRKIGCFDKAFLRKVMADMENCSCSSLMAYYEQLRAHPDGYQESYLAKLSRLVTVLELYEPCRETDICRINASSTLVPCKDAGDYSLSELDDLYDDIAAGTYPYVQAYENLEHWNAAHGRWRNTLNALSLFAFGGRVNERLATVLIMGYRCVFAPTVLLSNYFPYLFPYSYGTYDRYKRSISAYYGEPGNFVHTTELLSLIDGFPSFVFHNAAPVPGNGLIAVNHAWDIGAVFSASVLLHHTQNVHMDYDFLHFLFVVDNQTQMNTLNEYLGVYTPDFHGTMRRVPFDVHYILAPDVGETECLWTGVSEHGKVSCSRIHP